jgi:hypothetical protein
MEVKMKFKIRKDLMGLFASLFYVGLFYSNGKLTAQPSDTLWTKTFGGSGHDEGHSVQQTSDGGYIITGYTLSSGAGSKDVWLLKTNDNGDTLWTKTFGGSGPDEGHSVQQTSDGGYIIAGQTASFGPANIWMLKTDSSGDTIWTKIFGGSSFDYCTSVQQTTDGGYIIAGRTSSFGVGSFDVWLLRTNDNGDTLWTKTFGGSGNDYGYSVRQTSDGGYIIAGRTSSFGAGSNDLWLLKTDGGGDTLWTKTLGGSSNDWGWSIQKTTDGGYIITGTTESFGPGLNDIWLLKTDSSGDTLWTKTFGGGSYDWGTSVQQTTDGGYIITGYTDSFGAGSDDVWLIRTDVSGDTLWTKTLGGSNSDRGSCVQRTSDNGYIITGFTGSLGGGGGVDVWLIKIAPDITTIDENLHSVVNHYKLQQNYPNPFNPLTHIRYRLPKASDVKIEVFDVLVQRVATLENKRKAAGDYTIDFNGSYLSSGIYLYRIQAGDYVEVKKMVLMK